MARTDLTVNQFARAGIADPAGQAVTSGNGAMVANSNQKVMLRVANASGMTSTLTFTTPGTADGVLAIADLTAALLTGNTAWYGPFETGLFNQPSGADAGKIYIDTTQNVTITAFQVPG